MWRFKHFMPKEHTGLDGRTIDIGNIKVHVRNAIAVGVFSSVYLPRDVVHTSKQYALKHIMCNDKESLDLVEKEVSVMKSVKGHPNVVTLHAHAIFDMGRTKEALLEMEFCEKSLVSVLENRCTTYFEEKQILSIFRDICNAVFAIQSPPIAHRWWSCSSRSWRMKSATTGELICSFLWIPSHNVPIVRKRLLVGCTRERGK